MVSFAFHSICQVWFVYIMLCIHKNMLIYFDLLEGPQGNYFEASLYFQKKNNRTKLLIFFGETVFRPKVSSFHYSAYFCEIFYIVNKIFKQNYWIYWMGWIRIKFEECSVSSTFVWVSVMVLTGHGFMLQILINFRPNITNFDRGIVFNL